MHVTQVDPLHHHRTLPVFVAAAVALVLAIATFVLVSELTSSGTSLPDAPSTAASSRQGVDGTFLDPAVFDRALAEATATLTPGTASAPAATGTDAGTAPSIIEHPGAFDAALAEVLRELALSQR